MQKQVEVVLKSPLSYSKKGEKHQEQVLVLTAPNLSANPQIRKGARKLRALGGAALLQAGKAQKDLALLGGGEQSSKEEESVEALEGSGLLKLFSIVGIDVDDICQAMRELAPGVITIGGETEFKHSHWDSLDMDDQEKIAGVYLQSFLIS